MILYKCSKKPLGSSDGVAKFSTIKLEVDIMTEEYSAESIQVLEGLEAVWIWCGLYLGDPHDGTALHHCIWEVVDNSVDEHLAGYTKEIMV